MMNRKCAVIGLGFGDEGKGMVTSHLALNDPTLPVIRYSGGQQAAHRVVHDGKSHVCAQVGSGVLTGAVTHWSCTCTLHPVFLMHELEALEDKGIFPTIHIDGHTPITTWFDVQANVHCKDTHDHGTCGLGVNKTLRREEALYSILFEDLYHPQILHYKLGQVREFYGTHPDLCQSAMTEFIGRCIALTRMKNIHIEYMPMHNKGIWEGSQGLMLDKDIGFFPHVTPSNVGSVGIQRTTGYSLAGFEFYYVTRAYQTRHGNGPMLNEFKGKAIMHDPNEENGDDGDQGLFRRAVLNLDQLKYALSKDKQGIGLWQNDTLVITCLDHVVDNWQLCSGSSVLDYNSEDDFVHAIQQALGIPNVMLSHTPTPELSKWK